jgi:2-keto-4-pentenoate hydratase/2-oxohepta-3-ene-1,7-dioic acid hydratase in catechol pathway
MKICRFDDNRLGLVQGDHVLDVTAALEALPAYRYPLPRTDQLIENLEMLKPHILEAAKGAKAVALAQVKLLPPVANPGKVVAAPVNYKAHLEESRNDVEINFNRKVIEIQTIGLFLKATSSIVGASEGVAVTMPERRTDHEIELVAIIGKPARNVSKEDALNYVAGYCIGLDMTIRGQEERSLRKSLDTFTVLGPWMVTPDEVGEPNSQQMVLTVNDEPRQNANTRDLILTVRDLISWASTFYTLQPGDILMTGTPEGVNRVVPGDTINASIEKIGSMKVQVRAG